MNEIAMSPEASCYQRERRKHNRIDRWCQLLESNESLRTEAQRPSDHRS